MSIETDTRHIETRKPGFRKDTEITTTKTYADAAGAGAGSNQSSMTKGSSSRRSSFSQQAQQLIPNVSKQQLAYGLPILLAMLVSLIFLGVRSSSYFNPPPPPTLSEQVAHKLDSFGHTVGGDYWDSLKAKTWSIHQSASDLADNVISSPELSKLKQKAEELKLEAGKQYDAANVKAQEYAAQAKKAGATGSAKLDNLKENGQDAYKRASLNTAGVAENVRHAVNEATEAVRHAAAETQESLRHRAAAIGNTAQQKVQDVKETVHNIKQTIKDKI